MRIIGNRILVKLDKEPETKSGIILSTTQSEILWGEVVGVSDSISEINVGDRVKRFSSCGVPFEGKMFLRIEDIELVENGSKK